MKHKKAMIGIAFLHLGLGGLYAQESLTAAGSEATGTGGTANYSVGQLVYTTATGVDGNVYQGVQQAYEIYSLGINETKLEISLSIFPNPTIDILKLKVDNPEGLKYQLYDIQGRLLESKAITSPITIVNTSSLPSATYLVKVVSEKNQIKTFKVIKN